MPSLDLSGLQSEKIDLRTRRRFTFLLLLTTLLLLLGLTAALILRSNIKSASYDPLLGVWHSVDGKTSVEFTSDKTMVEKQVGKFNSTFQVKAVDSNTLRLTGADGSTRQMDWLISEEGVLVLVSGESAVTYRR